MELTLEEKYNLLKANHEYLSEQCFAVFELFCDIRDDFDGSEYMQGKKDGLRLALAFINDPSWSNFNRDNAGSSGRPSLKQLFDSHRSKSKICCDETCFCWDVEELI